MLADKVLAFIRQHHMVAPGDLLLVGVSGGPDSLCLLHALLKIQAALEIQLHVAHLDHALRLESEADARFVERLAASWGLPCTVERRDVRQFGVRHRLSLEEAGRQVRYAFFGRMARELGAVGVTVGHTADDQVETILLHWLRGSGLAGLRGMQPVSRYRTPLLGGEETTIFRPLLPVHRAETEAYCIAHGLQPRADPSNLSLRYLRNRIRFRLLPTLESYNPGIRQALLRLARSVSRDYAFLEEQVAQAWPRVVSEEAGVVTLDIAGVLALAPALRYHLLRRAAERVSGSLVGLEWVHLEAMADALSKPAGTLVTLPRGLFLSVGYGYCTVSRGQVPCPLPVMGPPTLLTVPGETRFSGWRVQAQVEESPGKMEEGPWSAVLDLERAGGRLWVRTRRPGDRFQPLGMAQEKRLQDFLVDAKVPRSWRDRVPLVVSPTQVVWVVGWRIDDRVKVTGGTGRALRIRFTLAPEASTSSST